MADDLEEGVIEVQVIPQDDNWGETATTITETATSYCPSFDGEYDTFDEKPKSTFAISLNFEQVLSILFSLLLGLLAVLSPIAFIVLPIVKWNVSSCGTSCDGHFISLGVKLIILIVGVWALYITRRKAVLPRFNIFKISVMALTFVVIVCYWLFYAFRVIEKKESDPKTILNYSLSFADSMLFLHYLSLILLWIRQRYKVFVIKVIRNVDGACKHYNVGHLTLQKAAAFVLEKYYRDFGEYNPYLERAPSRAKPNQFSNLKFYDVDGQGQADANIAAQTRAVLAATAHRRKGRNDRFYEEAEFEKRVNKRKARLLVATEEAFGHVARMNMEKYSEGSVESEEAAQTIFPTLSRPLLKYLRTTRQQPRFPTEIIIKHLAHCISNDLSPKAFLEKFTATQPCITFSGHDRKQEWSLISADSPHGSLREGIVFQLKKEDISLVVTVRDMPLFKITEDPFDSENNKFVLRLNSETSV